MTRRRKTIARPVTPVSVEPRAENRIDIRPEAVARRAYEIYEARGCADGCDVDDWLQAERELQDAARPRADELSESAPTVS